MKILLIIGLLSFIAIAYSEQALKCNGPHEHYSETTLCCPDKCVPPVCGCKDIDRPSCRCDSGYSRDPNTGECRICLLEG